MIRVVHWDFFLPVGAICAETQSIRQRLAIVYSASKQLNKGVQSICQLKDTKSLDYSKSST